MPQRSLRSVTRCGGLFRYNLYVDPKAQLSSGHRCFEWGMPRMFGFAKAHIATYKKYPMKDLGIDSMKDLK